MKYKVTLNFTRHKTVFEVEATDHSEARTKVHDIYGYDPGVPVTVTDMPSEPLTIRYSNLGHGSK